ncbi:aromatic amino acid transport family protein [Campylobacter canadensis]|uniref:Serine transporter n=1 Tax=Campylobacter canadensis TaxID=449520 RepID=A0ABS7WT10_9BACT|nr:aromatic amino acid transport family protein [Campylobacter canadensis]MBZ7987916.1 hypothetical protein [Campylobacter canadensis]MBZ7995392.1 hypothetical protein [Campylobacter canadensis]MBZ7997063.1 hypothetical protein [Campylobacter canadensis]MBZ7998889.1 hypothetical protein [Campylobacter canadensis]MBZ8000568.1 hypothetical protein [Campylobacter canadensis]
MKDERMKFDRIDIGWIVMSIGMAIGAGIVFLPVQVGVVGLWVFLFSSIIGYPAMYLFQKLFINTLARAKNASSYPDAIESYLGKNAAIFLSILYFLMIIIWMFVYTTAVNNDSAAYLQTFNISKENLANNPIYGLVIVLILTFIAMSAESVLFKLSGFMAVSVLLVIAVLALLMIPMWDFSNIKAIGDYKILIKDVIVTLPFTLTSILFLQSLSPMVISYRAHFKDIEIARKKALRAMNISFILLFVIVFFYAVSFTLAIDYESALKAKEENISALAIVAKSFSSNQSNWHIYFGMLLNVFAVLTSFFGVFLAFREATNGILNNIISRFTNTSNMKKRIDMLSILIGILLCWFAIVLNFPILFFTSICSPIFGLIGCLIPAFLVYKIPSLNDLKGFSLYFIILTGILLCVSPFLAF